MKWLKRQFSTKAIIPRVTRMLTVVAAIGGMNGGALPSNLTEWLLTLGAVTASGTTGKDSPSDPD